MTLPLIPDHVQIAVHGTDSAAKTWVNTFYANITSTTLDQALSDTLLGLIVGFYGNVKGRLHISWSLDSATVTDRRTAGGPQFVSTPATAQVGGSSADPLPPQVQGLVSYTTGFRGKSGRGRTYITGYTEADSFNFAPSGGAVGDLQAFGDAIAANTNFSVVSQFHGVAIATSGSRRLKPVQRATAVTNQITGAIGRDKWATQRRRAPRP